MESHSNGRLNSHSNLIEKISSSNSGCEGKKLNGKINFEDVNFKYSQPNGPEEMVLKSVSFSVNPGEFVAFVGTSGSGKSTIVKLIERFYEVNSGSILLDGVNVKDLELGVIRTSIGLVPQEPVLFESTILANITYGIDAYDDASLEEVCKISGVSEFVFDEERFPLGLNTLVGSRGLLLSGGQKQRVALARALIKRPKILILDEATSSLDAESEHNFQEQLDRLLVTAHSRMTIVVIAHRLSTIRSADRIYVLNHGQITEAGSHNQLLELNGFYKNLVNRQLLPSEKGEREKLEENEASSEVNHEYNSAGTEKKEKKHKFGKSKDKSGEQQKEYDYTQKEIELKKLE